MSGKSPIEWTEQTWNPIVGCSVHSPGCKNCYAMPLALRIEAMGGAPHYDGLTKKVNGRAVFTGKVALAPEATLLAPLRRKKPTMYFVNSMGDLFHENVPDEWIDRIFAVMALCPQHTFQVLTKRADRMRQWFAGDRADCVGLAMLTIVDRIPHGHRRVPWPLPNVWLGVSTERQQEADERIPLLLQTPAAIRFISAEPLLGPIDLTRIDIGECDTSHGEPIFRNSLDAAANRVDWVIVGGESGPKARPMHPDWVRRLCDQCKAAGTAFFFKQWGEHVPIPLRDSHRIDRSRFYLNGRGFPFHQIEDYALVRVGKKAAGRLLDGVEHNGFPNARKA